jgi:hypothetical protein
MVIDGGYREKASWEENFSQRREETEEGRKEGVPIRWDYCSRKCRPAITASPHHF